MGAAQVPDSFRFVLKAPQTITHRKRLKGVEQDTDYLVRTAAVLKGRQGPLLFQLPPNFKKDLPRLEAFWVSWERERGPRSSSGMKAGSTTKCLPVFGEVLCSVHRRHGGRCLHRAGRYG